MSTSKKSSSKSHTSTHTAHPAHPAHAASKTEEATAAPSVATTTSVAPSTPSAAAIAPAASATPNVAVVQLPPADANIPTAPKGFVPTLGTDYRGIVPKKVELVVLPQALQELARFANWAEVFGRTAPPLTALQQALQAALEWSVMRNATEAWDLFSRTMEGLAWTEARAMMDRIKPTFETAVGIDATIQTQNPSFASLLGAAKVIAQRGVETRKANAQARAKGEAPVKGKEAQKVKRAQKIVADAAARAAGTTGSAPAAPSTPVAAAAPAAPAAAALPAVPTASPAGTNGAAH